MSNSLEEMDIQWKHVKHVTYSDHSHCLMRDNRFGIQWEQITNRNGHGRIGNAKNYFFIDDVEKEFTNLEEMIKCWNEIKNFDDPNNEIIWVKKIVPKLY